MNAWQQSCVEEMLLRRKGDKANAACAPSCSGNQKL
jgi:hypothetical protein